jgi:periplasmic protein CpxP/Spy
MNKVLMICLLLVSISLQAQPQGQSSIEYRKAVGEKMKEFSPQQRANLKTKKMVLDLDLTKAQQSEIQILNLEIEIGREKIKFQKMKLEEISVDDFFDRTSKMLDEKIAVKKRLQSILTEEQFEKFQKSRQRKARERRHEFGRKKP